MLGSAVLLMVTCLMKVAGGYAMDLSGRITRPTCVDIPTDLALCQNIGYSRMRMPNLLGHDSIFEVRDQSQGWIPLLMVNCDNDTQLFLCSLFSPVCLDRPIFPCRSLCQKVRRNCEPIMLQNCFPWPDMLDCDLYPEDNGMCIQSEMRAKNSTDQTSGGTPPTGGAMPPEANFLPTTASPMVSKKRPMKGMVAAVGSLFTQCHSNADSSSIIEYYCNADFVLKMRLKDVKETTEGNKYIADPSPERYVILKQGTMKQKDLNKMIFWTREGANCGCGILLPGRDNFLVMGHRDGKKLYMTYVHAWTKSRDFRNATRHFDQPCPGEAVVPGDAGVVDTSQIPSTATNGKKPRKERPGKKGRPGGRRPRPGRQGNVDDEGALAATSTQSAVAAAAAVSRATDVWATEETKKKLSREERRLERERERQRKREEKERRGKAKE